MFHLLGMGDWAATVEDRVAERQIEALRYWVEPQSGFALVRYSGQVDSVETATQWCTDLEIFLGAHTLERVLWDSRPAEPLLPEVRACIWKWLESGRVLRRSAILANSELIRLSANLSSFGGNVKVRAFGELEEATVWLSRGSSPSLL